MNNIILIVLFIFLILGFHELMHIISAKIIGLKVFKVGLTFKPVPHFFVRVQNTPVIYKRCIYLFSGFLGTLILLFIALMNNFWGSKQLYWAFIIQLLIETNPFYSDFVIFVIDKKISAYTSYVNHQMILKTYYFSAVWYLHFVVWTVFIILLFNLKSV